MPSGTALPEAGPDVAERVMPQVLPPAANTLLLQFKSLAQYRIDAAKPAVSPVLQKVS